MKRNRIFICVGISVGLALAMLIYVYSPCFLVRKGMTYDEVEAVLGAQQKGLRFYDFDGNWTGLWRWPLMRIDVTFDRERTVCKSPSVQLFE